MLELNLENNLLGSLVKQFITVRNTLLFAFKPH